MSDIDGGYGSLFYHKLIHGVSAKPKMLTRFEPKQTRTRKSMHAIGGWGYNF